MSEKTIVQKLLLKPRQKLLLVNAPKGYVDALEPLPIGVAVGTKAGEKVDVVQVFATSRNELVSNLPKLKVYLGQESIIWVSYPKSTSKLKSDINRDSIREYALTIGLGAVAIFSIDSDWSALRLKRIKNKAKE